MNGRFHCHPQTFPVPSCLSNGISNALGDRPGGCGADLVYLWDTTLTSLVSNLGGTVELAGVR